MEYAVVSYWNKRQCRLRERRRKRGATSGNIELQAPAEIPMFTNYPTTPAGGLAVSPPPTLAVVANSSPQNYVYRAPGLLMPTASISSATPSPGNTVSKINAVPNMGPSSSPAFMNIPPDCDCRYFIFCFNLKIYYLV